MTILLDVLVLLAFLSTLAGTLAMRMPSGPEGPVGAWILFLFPCLFVAILVTTFAVKGMMSFIPGGRTLQFVAAVGIVISLGTAFFASLDRNNNVLPTALASVPYLILIGCFAAVHRPSMAEPRVATWTAAVLLGGAALAGWGLTGVGVATSVRSNLEESAARANREQANENQFEQEEVAEYRALSGDVPLSTLLRFTWSRNEEIKKEAQDRVRRWPELDDALIELLNNGDETVISYVALFYDAPPAKLAPAWGAMLQRQRQNWNVLQYDEYAGKWEPNLSVYFEGAKKIQQAGGDLRPQLRSWYELLNKSKGLRNLAAFVKTLL